MRKTILLFFIVISVAYALYLVLGSNTKQQGHNISLVIGIATHYAPFMSTNADGLYEGFDKDIADALGKKLKKEIIFKDMGSMVPLFLSLQNKSVDLIMWGISITKERLAKIDMIPYTGQVVTEYPLIFWNKDIGGAINTLDDLADKTISVEIGSVQESVVDSYLFLNKKQIEKVDDGLLDIQYGKSDGLLVDKAIAHKYQKKYPKIGVYMFPLPEAHKVYGIGIGINKENKKIKDEICQAIKELQEEGFIKECEKKWGLVK